MGTNLMLRTGRTTLAAMAMAWGLSLGGCKDDSSGSASEDTDACAGGKCDAPTDTDTDGLEGTDTDDSGSTGWDPQSRDDHGPCEGSSGGFDPEEWSRDEAEQACEARRTEAFNPNRKSFNRDFLRWSCADIDGRRPDERGQEYCEYFAVVQLPDAAGELGEAQVLGLNQGDDFSFGQTPFGLDLSPEEITALEADPDAVVGGCVFTSWNGDIDMPVPERQIYGVELGPDVFQMKYFANTNSAAQCLIDQCMSFIPVEEEDDFTRGCYLNSGINGTDDRKSDSVICASALRLAECGCGLTADVEMPEGLAPASVRGFNLGSWKEATQAPVGCRVESLGDDGRNLITCDLTAAEVINRGSELKSYCQEAYADEVVVHIDVAAPLVACTPPDPELEPYAATCDAAPWIVQP